MCMDYVLRPLIADNINETPVPVFDSSYLTPDSTTARNVTSSLDQFFEFSVKTVTWSLNIQLLSHKIVTRR